MTQVLSSVLVLHVAFQLSSGFDVSNVVQLNNDIVQLMDNLKTKDDCENLVVTIRKFIGGLHFTMLEILHYYNKTQSLQVGKTIIDRQKPEFIDKSYNRTEVQMICGWETDDVKPLDKLMRDANSTWTKFVDAYIKWKDKPITPFHKQITITLANKGS